MDEGSVKNQQYCPPIIAEVRLFAGGFAPAGWDLCDGRELTIAERQAVFAIIGWRYGGDGWTTFALPDLRAELESGLVPAVAVRGVPIVAEATHA